jgi:hypothetical protein
MRIIEVGNRPATYCQKVSGSPSRRHSAPKPNLNDETDHLARWPISGQGSEAGLLAAVEQQIKVKRDSLPFQLT